MKLIAIFAVAVLLASPAWADLPAARVPSTNLSGTITTTGTFQSIQAQNNTRLGCTIQNNSTSNPMYLYYGSCGGASTSASLYLAPHQAVGCSITNNFVVNDQLCIAGTSGDHFFANFQ
ncbi:MAG: hypothetical protein KGI37_07840 [Alphaproteobacteria bacterium]|nr:hypothetical protein [Alphaproteobacteria bacterium]